MSTEIFAANRSFVLLSFSLCMLAGLATALFQPWYVLAALFSLMLFVLFFIKSEWALYALLLASFCTALYADIDSITVRPDQVIALLAAAALFPGVISGNRPLVTTKLDWLIIAYLLCNIVSSLLNAPDREMSLQKCLLLAITFSAYFVSTQMIRNRKILFRVVNIFLITGVLEGIYGIVSVFLFTRGIDIGGAHSPFGDLYARGTFLEGNIFGSFQMMLALIFFSFLFGDFAIKTKGIIVLGFGIVLLGMIMSYTRAAWLGFALGALSYLVLVRRRVIVLLLRYFSVALIVLLLLSVIGYAFLTFVQRGSVSLLDLYKDRIQKIVEFRTGTGYLRLAVWEESIKLWNRNPFFGNGTDSIKELARGTSMPKFGNEYWIPNSMLLTLHDTGLIGFAIFCAIQIVFLWYLRVASRKTRDPYNRVLLDGFFAAFFGVQFTYLFTNAFWLIYIWVFMAIAVCGARFALIDSTLLEGKSGADADRD